MLALSVRIFLIGIFLWSGISEAKTKPTIYWLFCDFPAAVNLQNPKEPPGYMVEIHRAWIEHMTDYKHQVIDTPFNNIMDKMQEQKDVCSLMIVKNPEREKFMTFGEPYLRGYPAGLVTRKDNNDLKKYLTATQVVDLAKLLKEKNLSVGTVKGRTYGKSIDDLLRKNHSQKIIERTSQNIGNELKSMLILKRVDTYIGYPFETQNNPQLDFYFIKDNLEILEPRLSCTNTKFGRTVVKEMEELRKKYDLDNEFQKIYERYYPKKLQEQFLKIRK